MEHASDGKQGQTRVIRWVARIGTLVSLAVIILLSIGQMPSTLAEWIGFVLYPGGICAGFLVAWWREGPGGALTVASLVAFYLLHLATAGQFPPGWGWLILASPGFLFLWSWKRSRKPKASAV
jgi:hypothetical protein